MVRKLSILQKNALLSLLVAVAVVGVATQANAQKFQDEGFVVC